MTGNTASKGNAMKGQDPLLADILKTRNSLANLDFVSPDDLKGYSEERKLQIIQTKFLAEHHAKCLEISRRHDCSLAEVKRWVSKPNSYQGELLQSLAIALNSGKLEVYERLLEERPDICDEIADGKVLLNNLNLNQR